MQDKKFFGLMGNASNFLKGLTLLETSNYGWTEKYLNPSTGQHWLKYMIDRDNGRYFNLMLLTPKPTTEEMIDIAFTFILGRVSILALKLSRTRTAILIQGNKGVFLINDL